MRRSWFIVSVALLYVATVSTQATATDQVDDKGATKKNSATTKNRGPTKSKGAAKKKDAIGNKTNQHRLPKFSAVTEVVERRLKADRNYLPGDLISRGDAQAVFDELAELGWNVADRDEIEKQFLADGDFLVKELRTKAGREFMRQVANYPGGFSRLDRLVDLSDGKVILRRLIDGPDGYKLLEYLTTAPGGREMGTMLSETPQGKGFNQSTGRIYTAGELLKRLKSSYAKTEKAPAARR